MKGKKLLAGVLSAAMVLGTMVMPAFADDDRDDLNALINAATTSEITLTKDATWGTDINKDITVDLNGKTVEITRHDMYVYSNVTFKNGNITMNDIESWQSSLIVYNGTTLVTLTFEGVNFTADSCGGGAAIIQANQNGTFITKKYGDTKTVITVNDTLKNGNMIQRDNGGVVNLEDTEIYGNNIYGGLLNIASIKNCKIELENIKDDNYGIGASNVETTIENSTITVEDCGYGAKLYSDAKLNFVNNSSLTITDSTYGDIMFKENATPATGIANDESSTITGDYAYEPYASVVGGYAVISNDRIYGDVTALMNKSLKVELWTETECIATTELKDGDQGFGDMIDGTERTVTFGFNYDANSTLGGDYWTGNYFNPTIEKRPVKVKVYVDGQYMCEGGVSTPTPSGYPDYDYKWNEVPVVYAPAKIGTVGYVSLEAALAAATANDTVTLYEDATPVLRMGSNGKYDITNAKAIDLNGHTLTFNQGTCNANNIEFKSTATDDEGKIKKGTIIVNYQKINFGNGAFWISGTDANVTFTNVIINADNLKDTYLVECWSVGSNVVFNDSEISAVSTNNSADMNALLCCNNDRTSIVINNTNVDFKNIDGHLVFNSDVTVKGNSKINASNVASGLCAFNSSKTISIEDTAEINITSINGGHSWNPSKAGIVLGDATGYTVAGTAKVNAAIYRTPGANNIADTITVSFTDVTEKEGEAVYDIYVETDSDKTINGLTAVQMAMNLTSEDDFEMTVTTADGVRCPFENGMYLFNFDGETRPSVTGTKIKIGQVKFVGYGEFSLTVTDGQAHATTLDGENVVTDYVKEQIEGKGTFDCGTGIEDGNVVRPTRKLTINIDFNNSVENQVAAYQDMTVTVTGPKGYEKAFELGSDEVSIADNKATIVIENELTLETIYNVEVAGAGYRTANYPVTMNDNKTLNFWNNYKDTAVNVEELNDASAKNATFLAGEIVKDGKINIYDLSAVVSYFGTSTDVTAESKYAKYDLNRDGVIDSKDVAYVLVSWGK